MSLITPRAVLFLTYPVYAACVFAVVGIIWFFQIPGYESFGIGVAGVLICAGGYLLTWSALTRRSGAVRDLAKARRDVIGAAAGALVVAWFVPDVLLGWSSVATPILVALGVGVVLIARRRRAPKGAAAATLWWPTSTTGVWIGLVTAIAVGALFAFTLTPRF